MARRKPSSIGSIGGIAFLCAIILALCTPLPLRAATGGSISGTIADPTGAVIPGAALTLLNTGQQTVYRVVSDKQGFYSFPNLPVGHYELTVSADGFATRRKTNLAVDTDSAVRVDIALVVGSQSQDVIVTGIGGVQIETTATHLGEVVPAHR